MATATCQIRHCAYCLCPVDAKSVKLCGKCVRRAYCSKTCQTLDWKDMPTPSEQRGQRHKDWCGISVGEEDLDWKVVAVEGKGLGIVALRNIPAKYRIMVEAGQIGPSCHPKAQELMPHGGTLQEKFILNELGCAEEDDENSVLCVRIARVNHSCDPNAVHFYDNRLKVKILFAERDIVAGEEISISYSNFNAFHGIYSTLSAELQRRVLKEKWGIVCPEDCLCRDQELAKTISRAKELDEEIVRDAQTSAGVEFAMRKVAKLLQLHEVIKASFVDKKRTLYDGFQIGITKRKHHTVAREYINQLCKLAGEIMHPETEKLLQYQEWQKNISSHRNYLLWR